MLEGLLGGNFKENATRDTIINSLEDFAEELKLPFSDLFITIKPTTDKFDFVIHLYQIVEGKPKAVRVVPLKEITG